MKVEPKYRQKFAEMGYRSREKQELLDTLTSEYEVHRRTVVNWCVGRTQLLPKRVARIHELIDKYHELYLSAMQLEEAESLAVAV